MLIIHLQRYWLAGIFILTLIALILFVYMYQAIDRENLEPELEEKQIYGELITWDEVNLLFPKYAKATIIDLDTGLEFGVQRRGGTYHADVQPLTAEDTAIMKKIYNDEWSWKRKAIILQTDNGARIAASMNGMPHGRGAIKDNNFNGHFCIHFLDSKTHGSRKIDLAHHIMIWKSANVINQKLKDLPPGEIINVFFTAVDQGELDIAARLINGQSNISPFLEEFKNIKYIKVYKVKEIKENVFSVDIYIVHKGSDRQFNKNLIISTIKSESGWKINADSLLGLIGS